MTLIITVLLVFGVLVLSEIWWRKQQLHGEFSRKFVHITVGSFVAFWPYFLTPTEIKLLSLGFLVVSALSKYFNIFLAIHSVQRPTWGEFWFALVVGLMAFNLDHPHIYTVALLEMSLADGLAAVIGTYYGNRHRYTVFGSAKSILGTLTFFVTSVCILSVFYIVTPGVSAPLLLITAISVVATILENVAVRGFDNLVIPLFVAAALSLFG